MPTVSQSLLHKTVQLLQLHHALKSPLAARLFKYGIYLLLQDWEILRICRKIEYRIGNQLARGIHRHCSNPEL